MASTYRAQTLMARNSAVLLFHGSSVSSGTSVTSTNVAVGTVLTNNAALWRRTLVGSSYSTCTTGVDVEVKLDADDRIGFLVGWVSTQNQGGSSGTIKLLAKAGSGRGAWQADRGDFALTLITSGGSSQSEVKKWIMGPFEGARFASTGDSTSKPTGVSGGANYIQFKITNSSPTSVASKNVAAILPFRWPDVKYAT